MSKLAWHGVGLVVDDQVPLGDEPSQPGSHADDAQGDRIVKIVEILQGDHVPLIKYRELPDAQICENLHGMSFLLMDWELVKAPGQGDVNGAEVGNAAPEAMESSICEFIKTFHKFCFAPVFVFSNLGHGEIVRKLRLQGIPADTPKSYVLVCEKAQLVEKNESGGYKFMDMVNNWIRATPTIQMLSTWGVSLVVAKNKLFSDLYNKSPNWPALLWETYHADGDDPAHQLSQILFDNLRARTSCDISFKNEAAQSLGDDDKRALLDVLGMTVVLPKEALPSGQVGCGDLFKTEAGESKLCLVVSCDCDCIQERGADVASGDDIKSADAADGSAEARSAGDTEIQQCEAERRCSRICVLEVSDPLKPENVPGDAFDEYGWRNKRCEEFIFPVLKKRYTVKFRSLKVVDIAELDLEKRIGRVLPPYITDIRQRLAQWNQRVGFPKCPKGLFAHVCQTTAHV